MSNDTSLEIAEDGKKASRASGVPCCCLSSVLVSVPVKMLVF